LAGPKIGGPERCVKAESETHIYLLFDLFLNHLLLYGGEPLPWTVFDLQQRLAHLERHSEGHGEVFGSEQLQRAIQAGRDRYVRVWVGKGGGEVGRGCRDRGRGWGVDGRWEEDPFFRRGRWGQRWSELRARDDSLYSPRTDVGRVVEDEDDADAEAMGGDGRCSKGKMGNERWVLW